MLFFINNIRIFAQNKCSFLKEIYAFIKRLKNVEYVFYE